MEKPIIGIVAKPCLEQDMWHYMEVVDDIRVALAKNNGLAVGILPTENRIDFKKDEEVDPINLSEKQKRDLEKIVERLDGVVLEGGLVSNIYEEEIARICIKKDIPLLGICSGFNNLVRALGGTIHIDNSIFHNQFGARVAHNINIDKNSKLFEILEEETVVVNSIHTCTAVKEEIKGYKVVATCPDDNNVEAIELESKRFVMGVKWHPELMDSMNRIFEEFVKSCKEEKKNDFTYKKKRIEKSSIK